MRTASSQIWDTWSRGGPFVGDDGAPHGRVTVDIDWYLHTSNAGTNWDKLPIRWWQKCDDSQVETEVPNIKSISIDRHLDTDAADCTITIYNQWMDPNASYRETKLQDLGSPGYFAWNHGASAESKTRWGHEENMWANVLTPNALIRTYQGFGGRSKTIAQARSDGNIIRSGVWLVDDVRVGTNGLIELKCRDMAKLLIEQILYPPLVPPFHYPMHYARWEWQTVDVPTTSVIASASTGEKRATFSLSGNQAWYGASGAFQGHKPADVYDGNGETYWVSVGNGARTNPWAWEYVQADCGDYVDTVYIQPIGNYQVFISVMENGAWQGTDTITYDPGCGAHGCVGRYHDGPFEARIPYVMQAGIADNTPTEFTLPRAYKADKIRCTFTQLIRWAGSYRAVVREVKHFLRNDATAQSLAPVQQRIDGNFRDFTDIIKDLVLWAGWWCEDDSVPANSKPQVYGNLESTGVPGDVYEGVDYDITSTPFDKLPVIDAITKIKEIVGYNFWIDDEGGVRFEPPNWWMPGNNFHEDGSRTSFVPEVDEKLVLTDYQVQYSDRNNRSEIMITTYDPMSVNPGDSTTVTTKFTPKVYAGTLRGMVRPAIYELPLGITITKKDQEAMAEIMAFQLWFQQRPGQATCIGNPAIQINDQVRIYERQTGETYIHYVRGIASQMDLDTGQYTMTLTTNWLGDETQWVIDVNDGHIGP